MVNFNIGYNGMGLLEYVVNRQKVDNYYITKVSSINSQETKKIGVDRFIHPSFCDKI